MICFRRRVWLISSICLILFWPTMVLAQAVPLFKKYNPDIDKYAFTKSFIVSVGYYKRVADRSKAEGELKAKKKSDLKLVQEYINNCTLDNTELRIARNMVTKFTSSGNGLVQKVAYQAIEAYDRMLALSVLERGLWQAFYNFKSTGRPADFDEEMFVSKQFDIIADKKEAEKKLLAVSMLIRKVLLSADRCSSEDCQYLAITKKDRLKLITYLDDFARDNMEWGLKAGQTPVEGCVAAIREVLEDSIFISRDQ